MASSIVRTIFRSHILRNSVFFSAIFGASEISQETILKKEHYDSARIGRFAIYGFSCHGPVNHIWVHFIERVLPGTSMKTIIKKVLIGQVTINPVLTSAFYVGINLLEGKHDLFEEVREKFGTTYAASWVIWPVAMFITFRLVPPHYRPAAIAITGFAWANFLCYMKTFNMHRTDLKPLGSSTKLSSVDAERILIPNKCSALKQEPTI